MKNYNGNNKIYTQREKDFFLLSKRQTKQTDSGLDTIFHENILTARLVHMIRRQDMIN